MSTTLDIFIKDPKNPPAIRFPDRCVNCGKPKSATMPLNLDMGVQKRSGTVTLQMKVPLCDECLTREHRIGNVTWIPFTVSGLISAILVFFPVLFIVPAGDTVQTMSLPFVVAAFVGLITGLIAGTLVEFVIRLFASPAFGGLLLKRPLTVFEIFSNTAYIIGMSASLSKDKHHLNFELENDETARSLKQLNPQETQ